MNKKLTVRDLKFLLEKFGNDDEEVILYIYDNVGLPVCGTASYVEKDLDATMFITIVGINDD